MTNGVEPGGALGLENAYDATTDGTYGTYRTNGMDPGHISPMSPIGPICGSSPCVAVSPKRRFAHTLSFSPSHALLKRGP